MNLSETVRRAQTDRAAQATRLTDRAELENRTLNMTERVEHDACLVDVTEMSARVRQLEASEAAEARGDQHRREYPDTVPEQRTGPSGWRVTGEAATYSRSADSPSFISDLYNSRQGDYEAAKRLQRNQSEREVQTRALGNTGASGGSGGEWAPPLWLIDEAVAVARAGRVAADRMTREPLPAGVSVVNIPKLSTGTATAVQTTQNTLVASVDPTTTYLSSGISTVAGSNVLSLQLVQQSAGPGFDKVVLMDLAADLARTVDRQVLSGTGTGGQVLGLLNVPGITQIAYTAATPTAGGLYSKINGAIAAVASNRFLPPDTILMTPARWAWVCASTDASGRPLVVPSGNAFNAIADPSTIAAQGPVGQMAGLPVFTDANLPLNGAGQDPIVVARFSDLYLWESDVTLASFEAPYSASLGVLVRAHGYLAAIMSRQVSAIAVVQGSATAAPQF